MELLSAEKISVTYFHSIQCYCKAMHTSEAIIRCAYLKVVTHFHPISFLTDRHPRPFSRSPQLHLPTSNVTIQNPPLLHPDLCHSPTGPQSSRNNCAFRPFIHHAIVCARGDPSATALPAGRARACRRGLVHHQQVLCRQHVQLDRLGSAARHSRRRQSAQS